MKKCKKETLEKIQKFSIYFSFLFKKDPGSGPVIRNPLSGSGSGSALR